MMKPAQDGPSGELAVQLNRSMARRILTQGQKGPEFMVIVGVGLKDPAHMVSLPFIPSGVFDDAQR